MIFRASADELVSGVDFDDPEYGFKEEDKSLIKVHHEIDNVAHAWN